jgi:GAF domain-containing protein
MYLSVCGDPHVLFYAGAPITTKKGINIGAFCVLDSKSRNGLDLDEQKFLKEMSATIMDHLETRQVTKYAYLRYVLTVNPQN